MVKSSDTKGYDPYGPLIDTKETGYGFGARMGFNVKISALLSLWPKLALGMYHYHYDVSSPGYNSSSISLPALQTSSSVNASWVEGQVPLLFHLAPHLFAGLGFTIFTDVSRNHEYSNGYSIDNKRTGTSLLLAIGGWV